MTLGYPKLDILNRKGNMYMVTDTDNEQAVDTLEDDEVHLLWTEVRTQLSG